MIHEHIHNLSRALKSNNEERAAFEAAWLAHAVVDGLTPAHHFPLGEKIKELWGKPHHERTTVADKSIIRGRTVLETVAKNWEYWGSGGIFTSHIGFEWGVATTAATIRFHASLGPNDNDYIRLEQEGIETLFYETLRRIDALQMFQEYVKNGWTRNLAIETRQVLLPEIIKAVALVWYEAGRRAGNVR